MARVKDRESERPPRRRVQFEEPPPVLLACGDPRTYDDRELLYVACGTRVCDKHALWQHMCKVRQHRNPGHVPDP